MYVNDILNFTSNQPMQIATSRYQLIAIDSLVLPGSIASSEGEFNNCIGCKKQKLQLITV